MKKVIIITGVILLCLIGVTSAGCTNTNNIVGTWNIDEPFTTEEGNYVTISYTFDSDGTGLEKWYYSDTGELIEQYLLWWKEEGNNEYEIGFDGYIDLYDEDFYLSGNTLTDEAGLTYHK